jgi:hypothetical protein
MASPFDPRLNAILRHRLTPMLRAHGFRRSRNTYARQLQHLRWIVEIQRSSWNSEDQAEFTVECGVYVPGLMGIYGDRAEPESIDVTWCCLRQRLGSLSPERRDVWWRLRADDDAVVVDARIAEDIVTRMGRDAVPFLQRFVTPRDVAEFLTAPRSEEDRMVSPIAKSICLAYAAILSSMGGDVEAASVALDAAVAASRRKPNEEFLRRLRDRLLSAGSPR